MDIKFTKKEVDLLQEWYDFPDNFVLTFMRRKTLEGLLNKIKEIRSSKKQFEA